MKMSYSDGSQIPWEWVLQPYTVWRSPGKAKSGVWKLDCV